MIKILLALVGEINEAGGALKQLEAQLIFQPRHGAGYIARVSIALSGGLGEAFAPRHVYRYF